MIGAEGEGKSGMRAKWSLVLISGVVDGSGPLLAAILFLVLCFFSQILMNQHVKLMRVPEKKRTMWSR